MKAVEVCFWISFGFVFYTYLGYGILLFIMVKIKQLFRKWEEPQLPEILPEVTLFIAAYNEESVVDMKMENTLSLDYPADKFNIVWVTDGSNDGTNDLLAKYPQATVYYKPEREGKTAAMNRGIKFLDSPIVIFTDANTILNKESIKEIVRQFSNPKVACVAGEKHIDVREEDGAASGGEGIYWRYESMLKKYDWRLNSAMGAAGELFAIRREMYQEVEKDTLLDDFVISLRTVIKGYKIAYCDTAYATERGSASMKDEEVRKIRIAAGGLQSIGKLKPLLNIFKYGMTTFQYISHRVLRWSLTPILLFLLLPLNIVLVFKGSPFYTICLILQLMFYVSGIAGYYLSKRSIKNKLLYVPYYFLFMNLNVFKGAIYLRKRRRSGNTSGAWEKAKRAE